jgi:tetratricopeptide (TPR) repeat protein
MLNSKPLPVNSLASQRALQTANHLVRRKDYDSRSQEFIDTLKALVRQSFLAASEYETEELTILRQLEEILLGQNDLKSYVIEICDVCNRLASCYKQCNIPLAKSYLEKALDLSKTYSQALVDRPSLYLNMCTLLSGQGKHNEAAECGASAVQYAQEDLVNLRLSGSTDTSQKAAVLAIAYHRLAAEEEHLRHYDSALEWHNKAVSFIEAHCPESHLVEEFRRSLAATKARQRKVVDDRLVPLKSSHLKKKTTSQTVLRFSDRELIASHMKSSQAKTLRTPKVSFPSNEAKRITEAFIDKLSPHRHFERGLQLNTQPGRGVKSNQVASPLSFELREAEVARLLRLSHPQAGTHTRKSHKTPQVSNHPLQGFPKAAHNRPVQAASLRNISKTDQLKGRLTGGQAELRELNSALADAAISIQTAFRGWRDKQEANLKRLKQENKVEFRGGKKIADEVYAVITITETPRRRRVVAESEGRRWQLLVDSKQPAYKLELSELASRLGLNDRSQLHVIESAKYDTLTIRYSVPCQPYPFPIEVTQKGSKLVLSYRSDQDYAVFLRDNVQGLTKMQAAVYIEQNVLPRLAVTEGQLMYHSKVLATVGQNVPQLSKPQHSEVTIAQGERTLLGQKYLITCSRFNALVKFTAFNSKGTTSLTMPLTDLCERLELRFDELSKEAAKLLDSVDIQSGALSLSPEYKQRFVVKELKYSVRRQLNTGHYECMISDVLEDDVHKILVEARSINVPFSYLRPLVLTYAEAADILEDDLEGLAEGLIVEGASGLQLARQGPKECPLITIRLTDTDNALEPEPRESCFTTLVQTCLKFKLVEHTTPTQAASYIQRVFRAKLSRERLKMLKAKKARKTQLALRAAIKDDRGSVYSLSILAGDFIYEAVCENITTKLSCKIEKVEVVDAKIKSVGDIVSMLRIVGGQLLFVGKTTTSVLNKPAITAFKNALEVQAKRKTRKLLVLQSKQLGGEVYMLAIYEVESGMLVECFKPDVSGIVSLVLTRSTLKETFNKELPLEEIIDTVCLDKDQLTLKPKVILIRSTSSQDQGLDLLKNYEALYKQRIVTRGTKLFRNKLYVVVMLIERTDPSIDSVFNDSDKLTFEVLAASEKETRLSVSIDLKTAAEITGLQNDLLLPIGNIIINRMLLLQDGQLLIDSSSGPIDRDQNASKIKAHLRGFVVRKNLLGAVQRLRKEQCGKLILLKAVELDEKVYGVAVRLIDSELRIDASNFREVIQGSVSTEVFERFRRISPERAASDYILPTLRVENIEGSSRLTFDTTAYQRTTDYEDTNAEESNTLKQRTPTNLTAKPLRFFSEVEPKLLKKGFLGELTSKELSSPFSKALGTEFRDSLSKDSG